MSEIKAQLNYHRMSPRKVRAVTGLILGKKANKALAQLNFLNKKSSLPLAKLLKSAINNAKNNFKIEDSSKLVIKSITVNSGPVLKRYVPRSRGMANMIRKKTSNVTIILQEQPK